MVMVMMVTAGIPVVVMMVVMMLRHLHVAGGGRVDLRVVHHFQYGGGVGNRLQKLLKRTGGHHLVNLGG
jgi:hypothetical protein